MAGSAIHPRPEERGFSRILVNADTVLGAGHTDWRLPTLDQLKTLIGDGDRPEDGIFWSSTLFKGITFGSYGVSFGDGHGYVGDASHNNHFQVRLVRSCQ